MKNIWIELKKFLKNNLLKLLIGTGIVTALFVFSANQFNNEEDLSNIKDAVEENRFQADARPGNFNFYVKKKDGGPFISSALILEYLIRPEILTEVSTTSNIDLLEIIDETNNTSKLFSTEESPAKVVSIERNGGTNIHELYVNVGNEEDNLEIAESFYAILASNTVPFLEEERFISFQEPQIIAARNAPVNVSNENKANNTARNIMIGSILGIFVTGAILVVGTLISKKLRYSFSYTTNENDFIFIADKQLNNYDEFFNILQATNENNQVVLSDSNTVDNTLHDFFTQHQIKSYDSLIDVERLNKVERLVYIISENQTDRSWYNKQRQMERSYDIPVFIIQINHNFLSE